MRTARVMPAPSRYLSPFIIGWLGTVATAHDHFFAWSCATVTVTVFVVLFPAASVHFTVIV